MHVSIKLICLLLPIGFLSACAESDPKPNRNGVPIYDFESEKEAREELRDWKVSCRDRNKCPDSVAQMVMISGRNLGVCTATLIAPDIAITNSHCFDIDANTSPSQLCERGAFLVFPSSSPSGREIAECGSVMTKSKIASTADKNFRNPDYMVLKLKKPLKRAYEQLDYQGLPNGIKLVAKKVNPKGRGLGELVFDTCEILHNTFFLPAAGNVESPVHVMGSCEVMGGNSGSSLFDDNGKVRGLVFAGLQQDVLEKMRGIVPDNIISTLKRVKPSFATNTACTIVPGYEKLPADCFKGLTDEEQKAAGIDTDKNVMEQVTKELASFRQDPRFGYRFYKGDKRDQSAGFFRPFCYKNDLSSFVDKSFIAPIAVWTAQPDVTERLQESVSVKANTKSCYYYNEPKGINLVVTAFDRDCRNSLASPVETSLKSELWNKCE